MCNAPGVSERVAVVGLSGSGKTTLATELAGILGCPHVELDALHWGPGWTEAEPEAFRAAVDAATAGDRWVVCGNYWGKLGPRLWLRADTVVWLDLPMWLVQSRSVRRTLWRAVSRRRLWAGNRESFSGLWADDALWRYNLEVRDRRRARYEQAMTDPQWSHISFLRLRSRSEVRQLLAAMATEHPGARPRR